MISAVFQADVIFRMGIDDDVSFKSSKLLILKLTIFLEIYIMYYHINFCQNWTIFIRTIQNAVGSRHFNIGTVRTASDTFPQNF